MNQVDHRKPYMTDLVWRDPDSQWRASAACRGMPSEWWFPMDATLSRVRKPGKAEQVCADCPVADQCEAYAIATRPSDGIWAGNPPKAYR